MDRCALFVDAGYALADGAMAVHGTRRRDSVSWDHAGLLKLLAGLARDRTGLPVLRCYWYEIAEGRRTAEHDALAEMPGLKLRLVNTRPGRREGIESQLRSDLVTLAKSGAIADAFIASADEHLAEIVSEVQDLGLRVVVLHIASDGGWTIPQPLRQECDDIVEISGAHLRPFVDLIRGAEPAASDERHLTVGFGAHALAAGANAEPAPAAAAAAAYQAPASPDYAIAAQPYAGANAAQAAQSRSYQPAAPGDPGAPGRPGPERGAGADGQGSGLAEWAITAQHAAPPSDNGQMRQAEPVQPGPQAHYGEAQYAEAQYGPAQYGKAEYGKAEHQEVQHSAGAGQHAAGMGQQPLAAQPGGQTSPAVQVGQPFQAAQSAGQPSPAVQVGQPFQAAQSGAQPPQPAASSQPQQPAASGQPQPAASGQPQPAASGGQRHGGGQSGPQHAARGGSPDYGLAPHAVAGPQHAAPAGASSPGGVLGDGSGGGPVPGLAGTPAANGPPQGGHQGAAPYGGPQAGYQAGHAPNGAHASAAYQGAQVPNGAHAGAAHQEGPPPNGAHASGGYQGGAPPNGTTPPGYQNPALPSAYQAAPMPSGPGQHASAHASYPGSQAPTGMPGLTGAYPSGAGNSGTPPQVSHAQGGYQAGYQNAGARDEAGRSGMAGRGAGQDHQARNSPVPGSTTHGSTTHGTTAQPGSPPLGQSRAAAAHNGSMPRVPPQNGSSLNGAVPDSQMRNGSGPSGPVLPTQAQNGPPGAYQNGSGQPHGDSSVNGGMFPGVAQPPLDVRVPGQSHQYYGTPGQGFAPGQPGPARPDQQARGGQAAQAYGNGASLGPYQAQQAASPPALPAVRVPQPIAISLPDAVKAAHSEGYSFGESVSRDAPGLWLEAVLARKPRMPSDLEARLLQGSALPIDSLLHDEVRHSLRRGFWDALEGARR